MDNSLILSHFPLKFSHHRALQFIKERQAPPELAEVADALCTAGANSVEVWKVIEDSRKQAELTVRVLPGLNIFSVSYWSTHYPQRLRLIDDPPWNLFFIGKLPTSFPTLAIVGTRRPNHYGPEVIAATIPYLKTNPLQIISGLAYGIDSLAHFYACETGIPNFGVLGCGLDIIYPADHVELAARMLKKEGGLLSEHPPGTPPVPFNFPRRNRIISGLADVVWIVQGSAKSGSCHTARHALDQAKVIATTPGDIFSELSEIPHRLLFDGAHPIIRPADLDLLLGQIRTPIAV